MLPQPTALENLLNLKLPSPVTSIDFKNSREKNIKVLLKRDELIHPVISGNKWRKLKYNLMDLIEQDIQQVVSFGGAWSNHLHALACCCCHLNIRLTAMIRGEPTDTPSAMLQDLMDWGVEIQWLDRQTYRLRSDKNWLESLSRQFPQARIIPEGGSNELALKGVSEILSEQTLEFDSVCCAVGSTGTLAGLVTKVAQPCQVIGIPVVKGGKPLMSEVKRLLQTVGIDKHSWQLISGYEQGGYAKMNKNLASYIQNFYQRHQIILDQVYTGKLLMAVEDLIKKDFFKANSKILVIHSGGLQGLRGENHYHLADWYQNLIE